MTKKRSTISRELSKYLSSIGAIGGQRGTGRQEEARARNLARARAKRWPKGKKTAVENVVASNDTSGSAALENKSK